MLLFLTVLILHQSCIPTRIAPRIADYKITQGKKFKKSLPNRQMFIFKDPKMANEFYNYVNTLFNLNHIDVYDNVPFMVGQTQYFFSFYEIDIPNKSINLVPLAIDAVLQSMDVDPVMDGSYQTRKGNWYIAIEVYSDTEHDCLDEKSPNRSVVSDYLQLLKNDYLAHQNYNEILFKNQ